MEHGERLTGRRRSELLAPDWLATHLRAHFTPHLHSISCQDQISDHIQIRHAIKIPSAVVIWILDISTTLARDLIYISPVLSLVPSPPGRRGETDPRRQYRSQRAVKLETSATTYV